MALASERSIPVYLTIRPITSQASQAVWGSAPPLFFPSLLSSGRAIYAPGLSRTVRPRPFSLVSFRMYRCLIQRSHVEKGPDGHQSRERCGRPRGRASPLPPILWGGVYGARSEKSTARGT